MPDILQGSSPCHVPNKLYRLLANTTSRYLLLQGLVSIILSYELLFGGESVISRVLSHTLVVGLWLSMAALAMLPEAVLTATSFTAGLVAVDTILVTAVIYLSGNARSDLYIAYFVLVLVAASVRRLSHVLGLSLLLSAGYAIVLYEGTLQTGTLVTGQLLGIPVLLVMAVFYGLALERTELVQKENSSLLEDIEGLKKTEEELSSEKAKLEVRIKALRGDLAKANADLREGQVARLGLERRLHEAKKIESVGRVAARIAGEFGSLFTVIGKQTGIMLSHFEQNHPLRSSADEIFKVGERAATLTAQLIALNLEGNLVRHTVSVPVVLTALRAMVQGLLPRSIELIVRADQRAAYVEVDREGLETVLIQLMVNARDAMPNGGRLLVELQRLEGSAQSNQPLPMGLKFPQVLIQLTDTGTGMNLDTQSHMFEPFFSTKETNIGLGLTAVFGIVKQNGGILEVNSCPGKGTTVRLFFPAVQPKQDQEGHSSNVMATGGNETILLVEENEIGRKLALSALQRSRYQVLEAASSVEALMLTQRYEGILHLTVSPLVMPEIGGRELARRLMKRHPKMKALFVSSYDDETIQHHRINQRCVLQAPYRQTDLLERVREVLDAA